jgi:predicted O-methyltransferase YrrM
VRTEPWRSLIRLLSDESRAGDITLGQRLLLEQRHLNALAHRRTSRALRRRKPAERTPSDVLDTVLEHEPGWDPYRVTALQHRAELERLVRFLAGREPRTVLEIGTFQGGTLYVWVRALDSTRHVVSVDQPVWNEMTHRRRRDLYAAFSEETRIDVVFGDSHDGTTYEEVAGSMGGEGSVDLLFVDGDHSYEGVRRDFEMYRELVGEGGIVAFHDIRRHARDRAEKEARLRRVETLRESQVSVGLERWNGVSTFWRELRDEFSTRDFLTHPEQMGKGIGVVEL